MSEGKTYNFYNGAQNVEHIDTQVNNYNFNFYPGKEQHDTTTEAEDVPFEDVSDRQAPESPVEQKQLCDVDIQQALTDYLMQLRNKVLPQYVDYFAEAVSRIVNDKIILEWLLNTKNCTGFTVFNKGRVFRLARMLRISQLLEDFEDVQLNQLLEASAIDTRYRRTMNQNSKNEAKVSQSVAEIVKDIKSRVKA